MTKKGANAKQEEDVVAVAPLQLTFTEDEHRSLVDFMNFVSTNARFNDLTMRSMHEFSIMNVKAVNVVKKIADHIFEFKRKLK